MKRITAVLSLLTVLVSLAFADIHPRYRNIEIGVDASVSAQQNLLTIDDVLKERIEIDFTKMANDLGRNDMAFSVNSKADMYVDIKAGFLSFGIYVNLLDLTSGISISKDFFNLLGKGNEIDKPMDFTVGTRLEAFSDVYVPVGVEIGKLKVKVAPSMFIPIMYMPNTNIGGTCLAKSSGDLDVTLKTNARLYTLFNVGAEGEGFLPTFDTNDIFGDIGSYINNAGFDLMCSAEFELFDNLDVGAYLNFPLIPGKLNYAYNVGVEYDIPFESIKSVIFDKLLSDDSTDTPENPTDPDDDGPVITKEVLPDQEFKVNRPFRVGAEASFRPIGNWFAIRPAVGVAVRNPFGSDFSWGENMFPEYSLNLDMRLLYFICLSLTSSYQNQVYTQEVGFGFNLKLFELTANVASSGTSFEKSFGLGGVKAQVNFKFGI